MTPLILRIIQSVKIIIAVTAITPKYVTLFKPKFSKQQMGLLMSDGDLLQ